MSANRNGTSIGVARQESLGRPLYATNALMRSAPPWRRLSHENPGSEHLRCHAVTARSLLRSLVPVLLLLGCGLAPEQRSAPATAIGTLAPLASPAAARPGSTPVAPRDADLSWISLIPTDLSQPRYGQTLAM